MSAMIWALLTALVWGCVPILEKMGLAKIEALPGLFYRSLGVIFGAVVLIAFRFSDIKAVYVANPKSILYLIGGGFLASFVGQFFFYHALRTGEASRVVPIAAIYPLVSFALGVLFLQEHVTLTKIGGLGCILFGIFLIR